VSRAFTVLVKYCGGCNSSYDRAAFVSRLGGAFPAATFAYPQGNAASADFVLVVCGCPARCASHADLEGRLGKAVVWRAEEWDEVAETLSELSGK
jgi:hypothetical protein